MRRLETVRNPLSGGGTGLPPSHRAQVGQTEELLQYAPPGGTTYLVYRVNESLAGTSVPALPILGLPPTHPYTTHAFHWDIACLPPNQSIHTGQSLQPSGLPQPILGCLQLPELVPLSHLMLKEAGSFERSLHIAAPEPQEIPFQGHTLILSLPFPWLSYKRRQGPGSYPLLWESMCSFSRVPFLAPS